MIVRPAKTHVRNDAGPADQGIRISCAPSISEFRGVVTPIVLNARELTARQGRQPEAVLHRSKRRR